jgi:hypothetical protein
MRVLQPLSLLAAFTGFLQAGSLLLACDFSPIEDEKLRRFGLTDSRVGWPWILERVVGSAHIAVHKPQHQMPCK